MTFSIQADFIAGAPISQILMRGIDATKAGPIALPAVPAGKIFVPFWIGAAVTASSGVTVFPSISLGTNGPAFDNMMAIRALAGVNAGNYGPLTLRALLPLLTGGSVVNLNVTTPATAQAYMLAMLILGVWA